MKPCNQERLQGFCVIIMCKQMCKSYVSDVLVIVCTTVSKQKSV